MRRVSIPTEDQLTALERRARVASESARETVSVKPATLESLVECARTLAQVLRAARREIDANSCWCSNWPGPGGQCSWCQLKKVVY